jgi:ribose/xylose/arabinose/galactoside ABC-type transport system permease subunit
MQSHLRYQSRATAWRSQMTAIARAVSHAIVTINKFEILKQFAFLCAACLFVALLMLTYGVDLSPGFF